MNMRERGKTHRTWKIKSRPENERQGIRHHSIVDQSFFIQTPELNPFRSSTLWIFIQSRMFAIFFLSISQSTRFDSFSHLKHFLCDIVVVVALLVSFLHLSNTRLRLLRFKFLFILTVLLRWPLAFHAMLCVIVPFFSLPSSTLIQRFGIWWWSWCFVSFSSSTTSNTVQKSERHWTAIVIKYLTLRRHMMYKIRYITISHCELRHTHVIFFLSIMSERSARSSSQFLSPTECMYQGCREQTPWIYMYRYSYRCIRLSWCANVIIDMLLD